MAQYAHENLECRHRHSAAPPRGGSPSMNFFTDLTGKGKKTLRFLLYEIAGRCTLLCNPQPCFDLLLSARCRVTGRRRRRQINGAYGGMDTRFLHFVFYFFKRRLLPRNVPITVSLIFSWCNEMSLVLQIDGAWTSTLPPWGCRKCCHCAPTSSRAFLQWRCLVLPCFVFPDA